MISWYKMIARMLILTLFVAILYGWCWISSHNKHPHTIFYNGQIITLDNNNRIATALSIRSGRIESVGSAADVLPFKTSATRVIDLDGKTLIPGFVDAHSHFPVGGVFAVTADLRPPPLGEVNSIDKLLASIEQFAQNNDRNWVIGFGYDDSSLSERRHPTRIDIDQVISDRPVYLWHSSGAMRTV